MEDNGSLTRVAAFPIGIDPERFAQALEKPAVKAHIAQLLNRYAGRKVRGSTCSFSILHVLSRLRNTASTPSFAIPVPSARTAFSRFGQTQISGWQNMLCKEHLRCR